MATGEQEGEVASPQPGLGQGPDFGQSPSAFQLGTGPSGQSAAGSKAGLEQEDG